MRALRLPSAYPPGGVGVTVLRVGSRARARCATAVRRVTGRSGGRRSSRDEGDAGRGRGVSRYHLAGGRRSQAASRASFLRAPARWACPAPAVSPNSVGFTLDPENLGRSFVVGIDESEDQTRLIFDRKRTSYTVDGFLQRGVWIESPSAATSRNRLLEPALVFNPYAELVDLPGLHTEDPARPREVPAADQRPSASWHQWPAQAQAADVGRRRDPRIHRVHRRRLTGSLTSCSPTACWTTPSMICHGRPESCWSSSRSTSPTKPMRRASLPSRWSFSAARSVPIPRGRSPRSATTSVPSPTTSTSSSSRRAVVLPISTGWRHTMSNLDFLDHDPQPRGSDCQDRGPACRCGRGDLNELNTSEQSGFGCGNQLSCKEIAAPGRKYSVHRYPESSE